MPAAIDTAAIESLRAFAALHGELEFAHLCTAALNGEEWAQREVDAVLDHIADAENSSTSRCEACDRSKLDIIRSTDTIRPDGSVARIFIDP